MELLHSGFKFAPLAQIMSEANEESFSILFDGGDPQFHWKNRAIFALSVDLPTNADDLSFASFKIISEKAVVLAVVGLRRKHSNILSDNLILAVAE